MRDPSTHRAYGLSIDQELEVILSRYPFGDKGDPDAQLTALAEALATSPTWLRLDGAILVVRTAPGRGLAFIGRFSDQDARRLAALPDQLTQQLPRIRYITYSEAERATEVLADRLLARLGRDAVRDSSFLALPRGGLLVSGMLSYALGLRRDQFQHPDTSDRPLVIVDDCSLTGVRFGEVLRSLPERDVIFAHLFSHPDLRAAIRAREPRVKAVEAAVDLHDFAPELLGDEYADWRARWLERNDGVEYWLGQPEHLGFPWSEPDLAIWNETLDCEEAGWRMIPPSACMKNRFEGSDTLGRSGHSRVQHQTPARGPILPGPRTFYGDLDGAVVVADLESGRVVRLAGVGGRIWQAVMEHGTIERTVKALASEFDAPFDELESDVKELVRRLTDLGLLRSDR